MNIINDIFKLNNESQLPQANNPKYEAERIFSILTENEKNRNQNQSNLSKVISIVSQKEADPTRFILTSLFKFFLNNNVSEEGKNNSKCLFIDSKQNVSINFVNELLTKMLEKELRNNNNIENIKEDLLSRVDLFTYRINRNILDFFNKGMFEYLAQYNVKYIIFDKFSTSDFVFARALNKKSNTSNNLIDKEEKINTTNLSKIPDTSSFKLIHTHDVKTLFQEKRKNDKLKHSIPYFNLKGFFAKLTSYCRHNNITIIFLRSQGKKSTYDPYKNIAHREFYEEPFNIIDSINLPVNMKFIMSFKSRW